jgi:predicted S18 family serine protease
MEFPQHNIGRGCRLALCVALAAVLAGCPSAAPQSPASTPDKAKPKTSMANYPSPRPRQTRKLRLRALTVDINKRQGELVNVTLEVGPNRPGRIDITISESLAGGTGNTLRASLWMAAFQASTMVGRPLIQYSIALGCDGAVDGSSMGVLLTAALMSAMTGVEIKPDVSLTGSLLPDGTVGPVGGLPQKL